MNSLSEESKSRLAELEKALHRAMQECTQNIPGWASIFSVTIRDIIAWSSRENSIKQSSSSWLDYIEWFSLISSPSPVAIRGIGSIWWVIESSGKQTHVPVPLEAEVYRIDLKQTNNILYTMRVHNDGNLTHIYNAGFDNEKSQRLLGERLGINNGQNVFGMCNLALAVSNEDTRLVEALIAQGSNVNSTDAGGNTPLCLSTLFGNLELVSLLLNKGADASLRNHEGYSALDIARRNRHVKIIEVLSAM